jgi:hypothetical protein
LLDLRQARADPHLRARGPVQAAVRCAGELQEYLFNKHVIHHQFCRTCGVEPFARGTAPGAKAPKVAINVRCLDGIDVASLKPAPFDGKSL